MRTALSALCLAFAGCSGEVATEPLGERLNVVVSDAQVSFHLGRSPLTVPTVFLVTDEEGWTDCWSQFNTGGYTMPLVDFETSAVLGLRVDLFSLMPRLDSIVGYVDGARAYATVTYHSTPLTVLPWPEVYAFIVPRISIADVVTGQPEIHGAPFPGCSLAAVN